MVQGVCVFFTKSDIGSMFEVLLKLRYNDVEADWTSSRMVSSVIGREILRGRDILMREGAIDEWLTFAPLRGGRSASAIPELNLHIGEYDNGMEAYLDMNSRSIANTQWGSTFYKFLEVAEQLHTIVRHDG